MNLTLNSWCNKIGAARSDVLLRANRGLMLHNAKHPQQLFFFFFYHQEICCALSPARACFTLIWLIQFEPLSSNSVLYRSRRGRTRCWRRFDRSRLAKDFSTATSVCKMCSAWATGVECVRLLIGGNLKDCCLHQWTVFSLKTILHISGKWEITWWCFWSGRK